MENIKRERANVRISVELIIIYVFNIQFFLSAQYSMYVYAQIPHLMQDWSLQMELSLNQRKKYASSVLINNFTKKYLYTVLIMRMKCRHL